MAPLLLVGLLLAAAPARADEIYVAVASNFLETLRQLATRFEAVSGHRLKLISGSTGKHYAQIRHGAPFDLYFAADARRPALLEQAGLIQPGSRFTYAIGRLVLWSPMAGLVDDRGRVLKRKGEFRHLAIANPKLAPYGRAARQVLEALGLWQALQQRIVRGENIGQAHQFVNSGNAELGLLARSQVWHPDRGIEGSWWEIPEDLYSPIEQQAVLLRDHAAARDFLAFVTGGEGRALIRASGYGVPDAD